MEKLVTHGAVKALAKNFSHPNAIVSANALNGIVALSSQGTNACVQQCLEELLLAGGINRVTEVILSPSPPPEPQQPSDKDKESPWDLWRKRVNFALAILANLTRSEEGAVELVGKTLPEKAVSSIQLTDEEKEKLPTKPLLELMLSRFLRLNFTTDEGANENNVNDHSDNNDGAKVVLALANAPNEVLQDSDYTDPYQHFASVLMNCSQTESARKFVLKIRRKHDNDENPTSVLQAILPQLRSKNPIRRRGIAGVIRNCCLERDSVWWFLNVVKLTKHLLYPLAGPEELDLDEKKGLDPDVWLEGPDKVREPDSTTRLFLVESLLLLCAGGRQSREVLRLERVYVVLKMADMVEEKEEVSERIEECVQFLRRDEEGTYEGSSDMMVTEDLKPKSAFQITMRANDDDDYDNVD